MADKKTYYYMRLKENFFDTEEMILLESMPKGYLYSNILLKLYLKSLKDEGRLMLNRAIPYTPKMIASITRHQLSTVKNALLVFQEMGLIEVLENGAISLLNIQNHIGKTSTEADRVRAYRERIKREKAAGATALYEAGDSCTPKLEPEKEVEPGEEAEGEKERFARFWAAYPRHTGEAEARAAFASLAPSEQCLDDMLYALEQQRHFWLWEKEDGKYIPTPARWLQGRWWEDEIPGTE